MEQDRSQETHSAYDSQDISSSQQESTVSEGHSAGDDGNSTSSLHDTEAINSAIMEVSGELVQGLFTPKKHLSGGSESSDISDDDLHQGQRSGAIARYPESSTGLSDNDWNPYATESDTNHTPRSPRSNASDDQNRVGFISKASIDVVAPSDKTKDVIATVSMTTGQMTVGTGKEDDKTAASKNGEKLDILKYMIENEAKPDRNVEYADLGTGSRDARIRKHEGGDYMRDSGESVRSITSNGSRNSQSESTRSTISPQTRRESAESAKSMNTNGTQSTRESFESAPPELERTGETAKSSRHSMESQHSGQSESSQASELSRKSQKSTGRESDRSDRLERLSNPTDDNMKGLIEFEAAQRGNSTRQGHGHSDGDRLEDEPVTRTHLTARLQPYNSTHENDRSRSAVSSTGYISIAERQRLMSESPDISQQQPCLDREHDEQAASMSERYRQPASSVREPLQRLSDKFVERSPSEVSMRRVSNLFEETKKQVREAVSLPRPDPSGSEERFPLKERLTWNPHDDSLMSRDSQNKPASRDDMRREDVTRSIRDTEVVRSMNSEEVARVLGRYAENEDKGIATSTPIVGNNDQPQQVVSAFDRLEKNQFKDDEPRTISDVSDDEIARKVQAILARSDELGIRQGGQKFEPRSTREEYIPRNIDYGRLEKDLEEIQGSLHDVPRPKANDSMPMMGQTRGDAASAASDPYRSLESTGTTTLRESGASEFPTLGRESGASEYGRRLAWDHGADLDYDPTYGGQFLGTTTSTETTDTLSQRLRRLGVDSDNLVVRPDSTTTNDTDNDAADLDTLGTKTLTGSDISRAEKLVEQVMNRQAEGDLKESVEDIIARYRHERKDLFDKFQHEDHDGQRERGEQVPTVNKDVTSSSSFEESSAAKSSVQLLNGKRDSTGLAERVYKILTSEKTGVTNPDVVEKGMAKEVSKILTQERPQHQVNGILSEAMAEENEMLKKLVAQPKADSSMDDSGVNESEVSFGVDDKAIRKQLDYSAFSSPEKGDKTGMSDMTDIRHMTSAPYTAVSNAKTLLSSQLKKMSERNFDKTVELRTPYRQVIDCYPVFQGERQEPVRQMEEREAWMPRPREAMRTSEKTPLSNERFYLTDKDRTPRRSHDTSASESHHPRTRSDPFELSPDRRGYQDNSAGHTRSRSEETPGDLEHLRHVHDNSYTDRRAASSPRSFMGPRRAEGEWNTPTRHVPKESSQSSMAVPAKVKDWSCECYSSLSTSSSLPGSFEVNNDCSLQHNHGDQITSNNTAQNTGRYSNSYNRSNSAFIPFDLKFNKCKSQIDKRVTLVEQLVKSTSPEKILKHERESRSKERSGRRKRVKICEPTSMSSSLPSYYRGRGYVGSAPVMKDDVYDLLTRSLAQERKLAELQAKMFCRVSSLDRSHPTVNSSRMSHTDSYGYASNCLSPQQRHSNYEPQQEGSLSESETSSSRKAARLRPYRPAGSRDVYYTESGDDTNESGTTMESTHPGSDDAMPPHIPRQYLGSRAELQRSADTLDSEEGVLGEQMARVTSPALLYLNSTILRHRTPIYYKHRLLLREIFASEVQGERGEIIPGQASRQNPSGRASDPSGLQRESGLDTGYQSKTNNSNPKLSTSQSAQLEGPGFRTREEFERDFAQRERELRAEMQHRLSQRRSDHNLGASTRSDPGGMLEEGGPSWEYCDLDDSEGFKMLEPEPAYPRERLRCSRSKSDTNLLDISPNESQKYSSPMQPGTRFLELSTQPSPIFGHQDSLTIPARHIPSQEQRSQPPDLPRVPLEREMAANTERRQGKLQVDNLEPVRPLEPGDVPQMSVDLEVVRPLEPGDRARSIDYMGPVDLGADPRSIPLEMRRVQSDIVERSRSPSAHRSRSPAERRSKSPMQIRQQEMEKQLEQLNQQLNDQVQEIHVEKKQDENFEDQFPPSKKAQVLREVLEQEYNDRLPPNINDMWTRFQVQRDQSVSESSLNSTRLDALSGLLQNPTSHAVNSFIKTNNDEDKQLKRIVEEKGSNREACGERSEEEHRQEREKLEKELKSFEARATAERSQRKQQLRQRQQSSEEDSNGSYQEILLEKSRRKEKRRSAEKQKESPSSEKRERRKKSPEKMRADRKAWENKENDGKVEKGLSTDIKHKTAAKSSRSQHNDSVDTLFSIPEDASFEQSPSKAESEMRAKQRRHRHVIDPLMSKLRDKIKMQRVKIDKERRKEFQRVEKLKKLELLLKAKTKGKLSDKAIDVELENVSSTTSVSPSEQSSHLFSDSTVASTAIEESDGSHIESTTFKDDTVDTIKLQVKKYATEKFASPKKAFVELTDSTETSDFSNIVVERLPEKKLKDGRRSASKGKKVRVDEFGNRIRKEKKEKKSKRSKDEYNAAELMEEERLRERVRTQHPSPDRVMRQTHKSPERRYNSPDQRGRLMQDACTMYPSPITVSPPSRRRLREVLMKSTAIQTSPSVRSTSPTYSYEEAPVVSVPTMSQKTKTSRRRPSPSPTRSSPAPSRKSSKSPSNSRRSPVSFTKGSRSSRKSSSSPLRHNMPRKTVNNPMWKPEGESAPPDNSMFTPEDENTQPLKDTMEQATTWFIPMKKSDRPWRQPLKERQAFSVRQETWQPTSVTQSAWKDIMHGDVLKNKGDPNDVSRDTKFDLDPEGQPIRDEETLTDSDEEIDTEQSKSKHKMSLQDAFQIHKQRAISGLRERQKRLTLAAEQRKMEVFLKMERDKLFHEERRKEANPEAHPYSDNLYKPARRVITKEEMKEMALKRYKKLPEVVQQEKLKKRQEEYSLNRLRARLFNRKMQRKVLQSADKWGH